MKFLTFRLSSPLQSWGDSARWDHRSTATLPSKSAIIGLLGCCLGYCRGDERLQILSKSLHLAVRSDSRGRLMWDFQTVQRPGGKILNAQGKPRGETIITPKQYLQEASFQVFLFGEEKVLETCMEAMRHPRWAPYLGRRSCPPAAPILPSIVEYSTPEEALGCYFDPRVKNHNEFMECQIEKIPGSQVNRVITRMDEPIRADLNEYLERSVYSCMVRRSDGQCI